MEGITGWFGWSKKTKTPDQEDLPKYDTFNDLPPEFQLTPEHDENYIFDKELELVEKVREQLEDVRDWPVRYVLIFLFARRHSIPHTVTLLKKHIKWLDQMGFKPVSKTNMYPFKPEELDEAQKEYALFGGHTLFKHNLVDKRGRILQYRVMRDWYPKKYSWKAFTSTTVWWYYYAFQFIPLRHHREGMSVVVDMKDMGWENIDFSKETLQFLTDAITGLPGRMRVCWIANSNWMLSTAMGVAKYVLSAKIIGRMHAVTGQQLADEIAPENLPVSLGGTWNPDLRKEWYDLIVQWDREKQESLQTDNNETNKTSSDDQDEAEQAAV